MNIVITKFETSEAMIRKVRSDVFLIEQNIPEEIEWDGKDHACIHALAIEDERPVGTGRISLAGKIGRLAVIKEYRRKGVGSLLLNTLIKAAGAEGINAVHLHAQVLAVKFYEKEGFKRKGNIFMEADIEHIYMSKAASS